MMMMVRLLARPTLPPTAKKKRNRMMPLEMQLGSAQSLQPLQQQPPLHPPPAAVAVMQKLHPPQPSTMVVVRMVGLSHSMCMMTAGTAAPSLPHGNSGKKHVNSVVLHVLGSLPLYL
jgi:hypothetical protein